MKPIRCVAIDDEPLALTILNEYVAKTPVLKMDKMFTDPMEALLELPVIKPDILFIDIQMPEMKGIDLIKILTYKPIVIFTTAYSQYAIESYNLDAVDYLLKPIPFDRFLQAVNKAIRLINNETDEIATEKEFLFVKSGYKSVKINFNEILYIEGLKEYVTIYTSSQKVIKLDTLKNLEVNLPLKKFLRVHKSFIINIGQVKSFYGNTIEIADKKIPVGRVYKDSVMTILK